MSEIVTTMKQCWDQDPDARVSASNVKEAFKHLMEMPILNNASIHRERPFNLNDEENARLIINNIANNAN